MTSNHRRTKKTDVQNEILNTVSQPADDSKKSNGVNSLLPNQNSNPLQKSRKGGKKKKKKKKKNKREGDDAKIKDEQRRNPESPKCWPPPAWIRERKEQQLVAHTARASKF
jgi:hypothetical protein